MSFLKSASIILAFKWEQNNGRSVGIVISFQPHFLPTCLIWPYHLRLHNIFSTHKATKALRIFPTDLCCNICDWSKSCFQVCVKWLKFCFFLNFSHTHSEETTRRCRVIWEVRGNFAPVCMLFWFLPDLFHT